MEPVQAASAGGPVEEMRVVATPTSMPTPTAPPATPISAPTTAQAASPPAPAPKVALPDGFDRRFAQAWSELMNSTATTPAGEKIPAFVSRVAEKSNLKISIDKLGPNVGGVLESVASMDGDRAKILQRTITMNADVMNESPRVLAAMLAHEITHANQPAVAGGKNVPDCLDAEVEAYGIQARVWAGFWGQGQRPSQTSWERSTSYIEDVWRDGGEAGLRQMVREETDMDAHSCVQ
jgi:hypothetical protein